MSIYHIDKSLEKIKSYFKLKNIVIYVTNKTKEGMGELTPFLNGYVHSCLKKKKNCYLRPAYNRGRRMESYLHVQDLLVSQMYGILYSMSEVGTDRPMIRLQ